MTREKLFVEILGKLSGLDKDDLILIDRVTDSFCINQSVKKAVCEGNVKQLHDLVAV